MKKVLVTGATGFIGSYVVEELLRKGYEVIATSSGNGTKEWPDPVKHIAFDLRSFDSHTNYFEFFGKPDMLIHIAWEGLPNYQDDFHLEQNLPRHKAFLHNLLANGLQDITVTGTCLEYGMREGCLREDMKPLPENPYAMAKDALRKYLEEMQLQFPFHLKWVRLFYMYGRGQNSKSLISQLERALADNEAIFNMSGGEQVRDFLPVATVAEYIVAIAAQQKVEGIINCCSGKPTSVKELVQNYLSEKNKQIQLNFGYYPYTSWEPMRFWGDNTKLKSIISND